MMDAAKLVAALQRKAVVVEVGGWGGAQLVGGGGGCVGVWELVAVLQRKAVVVEVGGRVGGWGHSWWVEKMGAWVCGGTAGGGTPAQCSCGGGGVCG